MLVLPDRVVVAVVGEDVGLALGLLLPELQPATTRPTLREAAAKNARLFTAVTIRPGSRLNKCHEPFKRALFKLG